MRDVRDIGFLIIGAAKCATTWLQRCLQADPAVYMPGPELHFFSREFEKGIAWYTAQFDCDDRQRLIGEKSNSYIEDPAAALRIREALPEVKFILQMRNPVERAYSDYCMLYRRGEVGKRIEDYLDPRNAAEQRFISNGCYAEQLDRYLQIFPRERFLFLLYENIATMPDCQVYQTRRFLELQEEDFSFAYEQKVKDKTTKVISPALKPYLKPLKPLINPWRSNPAVSAVLAALRREIAHPPLTDELRVRLAGYYEPHNARLQSMVELDLTQWSTNVRQSA